MEQVNGGGMSCTEATLWLGASMILGAAYAATGWGMVGAFFTVGSGIRAVMTSC